MKGVRVLLNAFQHVIKGFPKTHLLLVGNGEDRIGLEELSVGLKIEKDVTFAGDVNDVKPYLRASDIFVLPSFGEGISNSLLEAMSTGLACVATKVGGSADLLSNGQNGVLVSPNNVDELTDALITLVKDKEQRENFGNVARQFVLLKYDFTSVGARYLSLYNELASGR